MVYNPELPSYKLQAWPVTLSTNENSRILESHGPNDFQAKHGPEVLWYPAFA